MSNSIFLFIECFSYHFFNFVYQTMISVLIEKRVLNSMLKIWCYYVSYSDNRLVEGAFDYYINMNGSETFLDFVSMWYIKKSLETLLFRAQPISVLSYELNKMPQWTDQTYMKYIFVSPKIETILCSYGAQCLVWVQYLQLFQILLYYVSWAIKNLFKMFIFKLKYKWHQSSEFLCPFFF